MRQRIGHGHHDGTRPDHLQADRGEPHSHSHHANEPRGRGDGRNHWRSGRTLRPRQHHPNRDFHRPQSCARTRPRQWQTPATWVQANSSMRSRTWTPSAFPEGMSASALGDMPPAEI